MSATKNIFVLQFHPSDVVQEKSDSFQVKEIALFGNYTLRPVRIQLRICKNSSARSYTGSAVRWVVALRLPGHKSNHPHLGSRIAKYGSTVGTTLKARGSIPRAGNSHLSPSPVGSSVPFNANPLSLLPSRFNHRLQVEARRLGRQPPPLRLLQDPI